MKTDETNFVRNREPVSRPRGVRPAEAAAAVHPRSEAEREMDAFDLWRAERATEGDAGPGTDPESSYRRAAETKPEADVVLDPHDAAAIHGIDIAEAPAPVRRALAAMTQEMAEQHRALEAAAARIERLEAAVERDPLTGLMNRNGLLHEVAHVRSLDEREGSESTVALIEIAEADDLRERAGRRALNKLQRHVADALAEAVEPGEILGAVGDAAFALILPGRGSEAARERLQTVLKAAFSTPFRDDGKDLTLSAVVGLVSANDGDGPEGVLDRADDDLRS